MAELRCVVEGCTWSTSSDLPGDINEMTLAGVFGPGVFMATQRAQKRQQAEVDTREHLESHDVLDFVKTITGLQTLVASQINTMLELTGQKATFGLEGLAPAVEFEPKT